jgi:hypothetical protein
LGHRGLEHYFISPVVVGVVQELHSRTPKSIRDLYVVLVNKEETYEFITHNNTILFFEKLMYTKKIWLDFVTSSPALMLRKEDVLDLAKRNRGANYASKLNRD